MKKSFSVKLEAFEVLEKTVQQSGSSGRIYLPTKWIGKKVRAVLIE
jgi:putative transposon-encoded protein